ncbi:MAG: diphthamide synthesis protein [Nanoarchaeota archaeon]
MKTIFVRAVKKLDFDEAKLQSLVKQSPKETHITYSIQYYNLAKHVKEELEKGGVKVGKFLQIIGCRQLGISEMPILHVGSGKFHATNPNLFRISKNITLFDGYSITKVDPNYMLEAEKTRKAKLSKYYSANSLGLLVSNKYGQQDLGKAIDFVKLPENTDKNMYLFLTNNINVREFENFPIDFWVNTACPRIEEDDSRIISLDRITKMKDLE